MSSGGRRGWRASVFIAPQQVVAGCAISTDGPVLSYATAAREIMHDWAGHGGRWRGALRRLDQDLQSLDQAITNDFGSKLDVLRRSRSPAAQRRASASTLFATTVRSRHAAVLQRWWRRLLRKRARRLEACVCVQAFWRGTRVRAHNRRVKAMRHDQRERRKAKLAAEEARQQALREAREAVRLAAIAAARFAAAAHIQAIWRGALTRIRHPDVKSVLTSPEIRKKIIFHAFLRRMSAAGMPHTKDDYARTIQRAYRGMIGRRVVKQMRENREALRAEEMSALARKIAEGEALRVAAAQNRTAARLQAMWKGSSARKTLSATAAQYLRVPNAHNLSRLFDLIDANGDQSLSTQEIMKATRSIVPKHSAGAKLGHDIAHCFQLFSFANKKASGVSRDEFVQGLLGCSDPLFLDFLQEALTPVAMDLMQRVNSRASGLIATSSSTDAAAAASDKAAAEAKEAESQQQERMKLLNKVFDFLAPANSDQVTASEFLSALRRSSRTKLGVDLQAQLRFFSLLDEDGSGQLTRSEWLDVMQNKQAPEVEEWLYSSFGR